MAEEKKPKDKDEGDRYLSVPFKNLSDNDIATLEELLALLEARKKHG